MFARYTVIEALVTAFTTGDSAARLPPDVTADEQATACRILERSAATADSLSARSRSAAAVLLMRVYRRGDDWNDLFSRLTPTDIARFRQMVAYMPPAAARAFTDRFLFPS